MATTRGRLIQINQVVFDQADYFQSDGSTREPGLGASDVTHEIFFKNILQPWPLVDGTSVTDAQVKSGNVYFNEVAGSPGFYNVRWRPNALGYWRLLITWAGPPIQIMAQDYDVVDQAPSVASGLRSSFIKPGTDC